MTVEIRDYVDTDREAVERLWVDAWRQAMPEIDFEARRAWFREQLDVLRRKGAALIVACDAGKPVAVLSLERGGYIDQLAVATTHQRRGVAKALLAAVRARNAAPLSLWVNADNGGALAFYQSEGFAERNRSVNERSGLPIILMVEANL